MKTVLLRNPKFTPGPIGSGKLDFSEIPEFVNNRLLAIINQTRNVIMYAEGQQGLAGYNGSGWDVTNKVLTLAIDTSSFSSDDLIQVIYDVPAMPTLPTEEMTDPVNKSRMSEPESLIDTDFEYSTQSTKWESLLMVNNRPTAFYDVINPVSVTSITGTGTDNLVTVNHNLGVAVAAGTPIFVQDLLLAGANGNGWYVVESSTTALFRYRASATMPNSNFFDSVKTYVYLANFYTGSNIPLLNSSAITYVGTTITVTTNYNHNLSPGNPIYVIGTTATTNPPNGSFRVLTTPTSNTFTYQATLTPTGTIAAPNVNTTLYYRPNGYLIHRAFDGGVYFTCGSGSPNSQIIRQTRRYFRYQSGKGIQFSTGTNFKPSVFIDRVINSPSGTTNIQVTTKIPHGFQTGTKIKTWGSTDTPNSFNVTDAPVTLDPSNPNYVFSYQATAIPSSETVTGFPFFLAPSKYYGSTTRVGLFDQQNGVFFENDGVTSSVVRRTSVYQIAGTVSVEFGKTQLVGLNTIFSKQLLPGDFIVIRGMSYRIASITSDTQAFLTTEYKGATITGAIASKTVDIRVPQSEWNIDKMDGSGRSGFKLDTTRMQMIYIDYSWYGAGHIRYGMRASDGNIMFCHKMLNNNTNTESYMRSGNLPARYEEHNFQPIGTLASSITNVSTQLTIANVDINKFPDTGTLKIVAPGSTSANIEFVTYTSKASSVGGNVTFSGLTRGVTGGGIARSWSPGTPASAGFIAVELATSPPSPAISHWGSSVIMDGGFDDDNSFIFNAGMPTQRNINANGKQALISLRLAPSVDSGKTGILGVKEVLNRMQLKLKSMDILTTGSAVYRIDLFLNSRMSDGTQLFTDVGGSSISQICYHGSGITLIGGEPILSFYCNQAGGSATYTLTNQNLEAVRDLGNSILGGGTSNIVPNTTTNLFPDGPDIITIYATNVTSSTGSILARLSWTEAQA